MKVLIIAEAGVNHNGSVNLAKKLIDSAVKAGVDVVKFQTFKTELDVSRIAEKAEYQKINGITNENQFEMLKKLELTFDNFREINDYCKNKKIEFLSTAFDLESIDFLHSLGMKRWKIPSGEITNLPYLEKIASFGKPVILSTGMCNMNEIEDALTILKKGNVADITVLHCTTEYPAPKNEVNLNAMLSIKKRFNVKIGYSDHTKGIEIPTAAVALGAKIIEKHFTLDNKMEGPDHKASLEPKELKNMVHAIRNVEIALGDGNKSPSKSESKNIHVARKSIIAKINIKKGDVFTTENITVKRPGNGISPMKWHLVLGKTAARNFQQDDLIEI